MQSIDELIEALQYEGLRRQNAEVLTYCVNKLVDRGEDNRIWRTHIYHRLRRAVYEEMATYAAPEAASLVFQHLCEWSLAAVVHKDDRQLRARVQYAMLLTATAPRSQRAHEALSYYASLPPLDPSTLPKGKVPNLTDAVRKSARPNDDPRLVAVVNSMDRCIEGRDPRALYFALQVLRIADNSPKAEYPVGKHLRDKASWDALVWQVLAQHCSTGCLYLHNTASYYFTHADKALQPILLASAILFVTCQPCGAFSKANYDEGKRTSDTMVTPGHEFRQFCDQVGAASRSTQKSLPPVDRHAAVVNEPASLLQPSWRAAHLVKLKQRLEAAIARKQGLKRKAETQSEQDNSPKRQHVSDHDQVVQ